MHLHNRFLGNNLPLQPAERTEKGGNALVRVFLRRASAEKKNVIYILRPLRGALVCAEEGRGETNEVNITPELGNSFTPVPSEVLKFCFVFDARDSTVCKILY